jgi:hypothetical protein
MKEYIYITSCPLSENIDSIMKVVKEDDDVLNDAINSHSLELENSGEEIFLRKGNMIATSSRYYFAFYEEDLEEAYEAKD